MSKLLFLVTLATIGSAHQPRNYNDWFAPHAEPPTWQKLYQLGESFHNAWRKCYAKTVDWLVVDLEMPEKDPTFDNSYYIEYNIKWRVPEVYSIFHEFLGADRYWPVPSFASGDSFKIEWGDENAQAKHAHHHGKSLAQLHSPDEETEKWFVTEHNHDHTTAGTGARQYDPNEVDKETRNRLKDLFYHIQQVSYYCDFTLESGMFQAKKFDDTGLVAQIDEARTHQSNIWKWILRHEVAPLRWAMKLWTRYNIAEPAIHKVIDHFNNDWNLAISAIEGLGHFKNPTTYATDKAMHQGVKERWVAEFTAWVQTCYGANRPNDDIIETANEVVCQDGITFAQLLQGKGESKNMWYHFFLPLLEDYRQSTHYNSAANKAAWAAAYNDIWESVMALGAPHSFRCEFIWLITRVRYFEIIPTWELARIKKDTNDHWNHLIGQRTSAVTTFGQTQTGLFASSKVPVMEAKKDAIRSFLQDWIDASDAVFDEDGELHRKTLRRLTKEHANAAYDVYLWQWQMGYSLIEKKDEGEPIVLKGNVNVKWTDQTRLGKAMMWDGRDGFRLWVWRELTKLHFHTWRRI